MKTKNPIKKPTCFITDMDMDQISKSDFYKEYNKTVAINYLKYINDINRLKNNN